MGCLKSQGIFATDLVQTTLRWCPRIPGQMSLWHICKIILYIHVNIGGYGEICKGGLLINILGPCPLFVKHENERSAELELIGIVQKIFISLVTTGSTVLRPKLFPT